MLLMNRKAGLTCSRFAAKNSTYSWENLSQLYQGSSKLMVTGAIDRADLLFHLRRPLRLHLHGIFSGSGSSIAPPIC